VATDAEWLDLSLYIPDETCCTFATPVFVLTYRVDVEFTLEQENLMTDSHDEPFSFSIPVEVYQEYQPRAPPLESVVPGKVPTGVWSAPFVQQQALLCLESKHVARPI
jgi:hypothetical protein